MRVSNDVLSLIFISLLQKCTLASFFLHTRCVYASVGKYSHLPKRESQEHNLLHGNLLSHSSLYSPVDIIATAPKISPQLTVNLASVLLWC